MPATRLNQDGHQQATGTLQTCLQSVRSPAKVPHEARTGCSTLQARSEPAQYLQQGARTEPAEQAASWQAWSTPVPEQRGTHVIQEYMMVCTSR